MHDVVVVGAGLAGAAAARLLADSGRAVLVLERNDFVGGNCADEWSPEGILVQRFGPHVIHTESREAWQFFSRFAELIPYHHRVETCVDGQNLPFPINRDTICQLFGAQITTDEIAEFLATEVEGSVYNDPPENFRDVIVSQVGQRLYEKFFHNYTIKHWQMDPTELSAEVAARVLVRQNRDSRYFLEKYQGLPATGFSAMIDEMLNHPQIEIRLATDYFADRYEYDDHAKEQPIIFTGKLDSYFNFEFGHLGYRSMRYEFRALPVAKYQTAAVVNYPNDYDFTRVIEYKQMNMSKAENTVICREYPVEDGIPAYVVLTPENISRRAAYLAKAEALEAAGEVYFVGRLAEFRSYNMDEVVLSVMNKLAPLTGDIH